MPSYIPKQQARLNPKECVFICVDIQEKLFNVMQNKDKMLKNANKLLEGAKTLGANSIVLEQYPQGLGKALLRNQENPKESLIEKISFSAFGEQNFCKALEKLQATTLILFGIETHICVKESAFDAKEKGFKVLIAEDACSSRELHSHSLAIQEMRDLKIQISSTESILFSFLLHAKETNFKAISTLIKN